MDAGDWIRLKRIAGMKHFDYTQAVTNPQSVPSIRIEARTGRRVYTEFGNSKIRLPASAYTDLVAANSADYIFESGGPGNKTLVATSLCDCTLTSNPKKQGICPSCLHSN
jgi:hypothetical protein